MGRYPWTEYSVEMIRERVDWSRKKEGTTQAMTRKLRYLGGIAAGLKRRGEISTTNPRKMRENDVASLFRYLRDDMRLKPNTLRKYLTAVTMLTSFAGNSVVTTMRANPVKRMALPHGACRSGRKSFNLKTVQAFLEAAREKAEASADWWDKAAYGFAVLAAGFGLRPKELRAVRVQDLEKFCWRLKVGYSKEQPDYATLLPPLQGHLEHYLEFRAVELQGAGQNPAEGLLVPWLETGRVKTKEDGTWTGNQLRAMFEDLRKVANVPISPKDLRTSFGQILKDHGYTMDDCSLALRHGSVATTQKWYVELRPEDTFSKLQQLFNKEDEERKTVPKKESIAPLWETSSYR